MNSGELQRRLAGQTPVRTTTLYSGEPVTEHEERDGKTYRRRVLVVEDWAEVSRTCGRQIGEVTGVGLIFCPLPEGHEPPCSGSLTFWE